MSTIVQARTLSLNSSLLIKLWKEREDHGEIAELFLEKIACSETRLLFTLHYVSELLAHESDLIVDSRSRFVGQLGYVFWIYPSGLSGIGDCLDLVSVELRAFG